jgi:hypothetical protein
MQHYVSNSTATQGCGAGLEHAPKVTARSILEHFQEKWKPVFRPEMQKITILEPPALPRIV